MAQEFQDPSELEAPEERARVPNPSWIRIPSTPGSGPPGVEQFELRTPADAADPGAEEDKMEALEKKAKELEDIIKQMIAAAKMAIPTMAQTHAVNTPGAASMSTATTTQGITPTMAQTHEVVTPGASLINPAALPTDHDDERKDIRPLLQKDMKAPRSSIDPNRIS